MRHEINFSSIDYTYDMFIRLGNWHFLYHNAKKRKELVYPHEMPIRISHPPNLQ